MAISDPACGGLLPVLPAREDAPCLWDLSGARPLSRADLRAAVKNLAEDLSAAERQLVFLIADNRPSTIVAVLAAAAAGHAVALIDPGLSIEKLARLLDLYRPEHVLGPPSFAARAVFADDRDRWLEAPSACYAGAHWAAVPDRATRSPPIAPELLMLLSTSGTTGSAKFVRLSAQAVVTNARQIATALAIDGTSVAIAHLPPHYSYGLSVITSHLLVGGGVFVTDEAITSPGFWPAIDLGGGTHFPGVPFHYGVLARLSFDLVPERVRCFTQAGGALDARVLARIRERLAGRAARFFVMYGQTEAAPRIATLPAEDLSSKPGSVGVPMPGGRLLVQDAAGRLLPAGEVGEIVYEGPNVMLGYAQMRADLARGDVLGGRLVTGDRGYLDSDGYLTLTGRTQRFAKIAGLRLGLDEIEAELAVICPVACVERDGAITVFHDGDPAIDWDSPLKARLRQLAADYKIPSASFVLHALTVLPRRSSGKIDYAALMARDDV